MYENKYEAQFRENMLDHVHNQDGKTFFTFDLMHKLLVVHDLSYSQMTLFIAIMDKLEKNEDGNRAITLQYLADATGLNKSTIITHCDYMEARKLLKRWVPGNTNKRKTHWEINKTI